MEKLLNEYKENFYQYNKLIEQFIIDDFVELNNFKDVETKELKDKYNEVNDKIKNFNKLLENDLMLELKILASSCINYGIRYNITNTVCFSKQYDMFLRKQSNDYRFQETSTLLSLLRNQLLEHNTKNKRYNFENITMLKNIISELQTIDPTKNEYADMYNIEYTYQHDLYNNLNVTFDYYPWREKIYFENKINRNKYILPLSSGKICMNDYENQLASLILLIDNKEEIFSLIDMHINNIDLLINRLTEIINKMHEYNKTFIMFEKLKQ